MRIDCLRMCAIPAAGIVGLLTLETNSDKIYGPSWPVKREMCMLGRFFGPGALKALKALTLRYLYLGALKLLSGPTAAARSKRWSSNEPKRPPTGMCQTTWSAVLFA